MKTGLTLGELTANIIKNAEHKKDYIAPANRISVDRSEHDFMIMFGQHEMSMSRLATRQLDSFLGIPARYADRMRDEAPDLYVSSANTWLSNSEGKRMIRTLDGKARAILSDSYRRIDNDVITDSALRALADVPEAKIVSADITETRLYIKAVTSSRLFKVESRRPGDFVEAGVVITNSEVGMGAVSVKPFAHFLVCSNGMIRDALAMRATHIGRRKDEDLEGLYSQRTLMLEGETVASKIRDVIKASFDQDSFQAWIDKMNKSTADMIEGDPAEAIEVLGDSFDMTKDERVSILRHLAEGGDLSRYGLANAVTRTAEDLPSYDRATEFEAIGGILIDLPENQWRRIAAA